MGQGDFHRGTGARDHGSARLPTVLLTVVSGLIVVLAVVALSLPSMLRREPSAAAAPGTAPESSEAPAPAVRVSATTEPSVTPSPASAKAPVQITAGPWQVTILSTDHDARDEIGVGNHPEEFPAVVTTVQLSNVSDTVQSNYQIDFGFGSTSGTQNGYNPWDDWCAALDDNIYDAGEYYLPGETRTGTVCVPVHPDDAADLEMALWYDGGDEFTESEWVRLPDDGETWPAVPTAAYSDVHAEALASAPRSAEVRGFRLSVDAVEIGDEIDGRRPVQITMSYSPIPGAERTGDFYGWSEIAAPSGWLGSSRLCGASDAWTPLGEAPGTRELCVTVDAADAESLLLNVLAQYATDADVMLDASPM